MRASIHGRGSAAAVYLLVPILFAMFVAPEAVAQTLYGTLVGNVTDPSNASIAGAKVLAANTATGFSRETTTDERGGYLFSDLQPGAYRIVPHHRGRIWICRVHADRGAGFDELGTPHRRAHAVDHGKRIGHSGGSGHGAAIGSLGFAGGDQRAGVSRPAGSRRAELSGIVQAGSGIHASAAPE